MTDTVEGVCEKCGAGLTLNDEGVVACDGCGLSSGVCTCGEAAGTTTAPPDRENLT